jgi:hypothetical protein
MSTTDCGHCGKDPCEGTHIKCDLTRFYVGNVTCPPGLYPSEALYQVVRRNYLKAVPGPGYTDPDIMYDYSTGVWSVIPYVIQPDTWALDNHLKDFCKKNKKVKEKRGGSCECGVWVTGGLHSDWCPNSAFDRAFKENR